MFCHMNMFLVVSECHKTIHENTADAPSSSVPRTPTGAAHMKCVFSAWMHTQHFVYSICYRSGNSASKCVLPPFHAPKKNGRYSYMYRRFHMFWMMIGVPCFYCCSPPISNVDKGRCIPWSHFDGGRVMHLFHLELKVQSASLPSHHLRRLHDACHVLFPSEACSWPFCGSSCHC